MCHAAGRAGKRGGGRLIVCCEAAVPLTTSDERGTRTVSRAEGFRNAVYRMVKSGPESGSPEISDVVRTTSFCL